MARRCMLFSQKNYGYSGIKSAAAVTRSTNGLSPVAAASARIESNSRCASTFEPPFFLRV